MSLATAPKTLERITLDCQIGSRGRMQMLKVIAGHSNSGAMLSDLLANPRSYLQILELFADTLARQQGK